MTDEAFIFAEVWKTVYNETKNTRKAETAAYWAVAEYRRMK